MKAIIGGPNIADMPPSTPAPNPTSGPAQPATRGLSRSRGIASSSAASSEKADAR